MDLASVDFVDDLHEDKRVEYDGIMLSGQGKHVMNIIIAAGNIKPVRTMVQDDDQDGKLIDTVTTYEQKHSPGDQRLLPAIWLPLQEVICRLLGGESKTGERVHNEIDPEQLNSAKRCVTNGE